MFTKGRRAGLDWEFGVSRCKLLHLEWTDNKVLLYIAGNYIQYPGINHNETECTYVCVCIHIYIHSQLPLQETQGLGRCPGAGDGNPLQKSHGQRSLAGYSPWDHKVGHSLAPKQQQQKYVTLTKTDILGSHATCIMQVLLLPSFT